MKGLIGTQQLISMAEHSAVMHLLTAHVIDTAIAQAGIWCAQDLHLRVSINVSARDLYSDDIVQRLAQRMAQHGVNPSQVQIEITEGALMADPNRATGTVNRIRALGVAISLDDFGTGYSSLAHLRRMPISEIKIDRSFVAGMAGNRDDAAIVTSTVELARSLGIRTVAEGVENMDTRRLLADGGCTLMQGWHTGRPMPGVDVRPWLIAQHSAYEPILSPNLTPMLTSNAGIGLPHRGIPLCWRRSAVSRTRHRIDAMTVARLRRSTDGRGAGRSTSRHGWSLPETV